MQRILIKFFNPNHSQVHIYAKPNPKNHSAAQEPEDQTHTFGLKTSKLKTRLEVD